MGQTSCASGYTTTCAPMSSRSKPCATPDASVGRESAGSHERDQACNVTRPGEQARLDDRDLHTGAHDRALDPNRRSVNAGGSQVVDAEGEGVGKCVADACEGLLGRELGQHAHGAAVENMSPVEIGVDVVGGDERSALPAF